MEISARLGMPPQETKVVGIICAGHFFSHFFLLLVPPLFPVLREVYGVGFTELGFAIACFSIASGFTQIPVGIMVDRYGAKKLLIWGLATESIAVCLIGVFPFYGALVALMIAAGLSNSVFHPADYAILNATVDKSRIGRIFSFHTFTGYLGDAVAPATILILASIFDWRVGMFMCGLFGLITAAVMWANAGILDEAAPTNSKHAKAAPGTKPALSGWALLFSLPIIMGLLFFMVMSIAGGGIRTFGVSALHEMYQTSLSEAGFVVSIYLGVAPIGVLAGGWVVDRIKRQDIVAAVCILIIALSVFAIAIFDPPLWGTGVLLAIAGFGNGFLAPSRDMIVRALAPPGSIGSVFGFVSSGFALAGIVAPLLYGWLLDHSDPKNVFLVSGFVALITIVTVLGTSSVGRRASVR
ncbi:MAG: MFS transporter [Betaproteobacteria bacterium]|nr:MFS transporter [Betaproteobacteria bacterium]